MTGVFRTLLSGRDGRRRVWLVRGALVAALLLGAAGCATVPTEYREPPPLSAADRVEFNRRVFERVWELVNERYFDATFHGVDWDAMRVRYRPQAEQAKDDTALYHVLNQMCAELKESHLAALAPRRAHELDTEHRPAVGVRWQLLDGQRVVVDVVPGGPAARAGVRVGWLVVSRNGEPLRDGDAFITHLGRAVTYGFVDEHGAPRSFTLQPELLQFERKEERDLGDGLIYLRFDKFSRGTLSWLSGELKRHRNARGVIIDLRQNSGGNALALSVAVAEFFDHRVAEGRQVRRDGREREAESFSWLSARYGGRVVLLTGANTASAAEIFSHVLQHHGRATVVGQRTAGAVIYSRNFSLPRGGSLQVPVVDFVGLDGKRLEGRGVTPDVVVPAATLADRRAARDRELEAALDLLRREP